MYLEKWKRQLLKHAHSQHLVKFRRIVHQSRWEHVDSVYFSIVLNFFDEKTWDLDLEICRVRSGTVPKVPQGEHICGVVTRRTSVSPNFNSLRSCCQVSATRGQAVPLQTSTEEPGLSSHRRSLARSLSPKQKKLNRPMIAAKTRSSACALR